MAASPVASASAPAEAAGRALAGREALVEALAGREALVEALSVVAALGGRDDFLSIAPRSLASCGSRGGHAGVTRGSRGGHAGGACGGHV
eukprot:2679230-Prymnesium_polylepis.1